MSSTILPGVVVMTISTLAAYLMTMMLALAPVSRHAYYEKQDVTLARYTNITNVIAEGVISESMPKGMTEKEQEEERVKIGAVMVSIGDVESGNWNADVVSCAKGGDNDTAWGPWQTQLPKVQVCDSTRAALRLALGMVKRSFLICKELPSGDRLSWYTDGGAWNRSVKNRERASRRSQFRMNRALFWVKTHPFTVNATPFVAVEVQP